ncbi:hypothetical protein HDU90_008112 [Geranomyces variabilis]|nr:hypothetical protein HDU90_008112 [Geranomyces variabilis]
MAATCAYPNLRPYTFPAAAFAEQFFDLPDEHAIFSQLVEDVAGNRPNYAIRRNVVDQCNNKHKLLINVENIAKKIWDRSLHFVSRDEALVAATRVWLTAVANDMTMAAVTSFGVEFVRSTGKVRHGFDMRPRLHFASETDRYTFWLRTYQTKFYARQGSAIWIQEYGVALPTSYVPPAPLIPIVNPAVPASAPAVSGPN